MSESKQSDTYTSDTERCPIGSCDEVLGDGHWCANPDPDSPMAYHTDKEGIARHWEHIDGLAVIPETDPYAEGTIGYHRSIDTNTDRSESDE